MTDPGEMRTKVVYQEHQVASKDGAGQERREWVDKFAGFAAVRPLSARELYYAGQTRAEATHRVVIRYRPDVKPTGRLKLWGTDRIFSIVGVLNSEERSIELVMTCVEPVPNKPTG